jgi:hypothetical protein
MMVGILLVFDREDCLVRRGSSEYGQRIMA